VNRSGWLGMPSSCSTIQTGGAVSCGKWRRHTAAAYLSAWLTSDPPSPEVWVATATGRAPGAVNSCSRNVPIRLPPS
jgi:hypothetical protein